MKDEVLLAFLLQLPRSERDAVLDRLCSGDSQLRARAHRLLLSHSPDIETESRATHSFSPSDFKATADYDPQATRTPAISEPVGEVGQIIAGKYKLVEAIGEGGMGTVWMAQQTEPVKRAVAVKLVKEGMDSRAVLARFEAERQALAMMDHPNIARVLDAGATADGRPYFVMELVKGIPITHFCDARKLTPNARLELFIQVCNAIQHAHQKGIIHRDIKPSNVLVALFDDRPVPKVIDFGVAKATGHSLTDHTMMTGFGAVVGTPEYMSPEQASFNQMDVDTRSDVYSLGVLLYELLTGSTPVDRKSLGKAALLEILRIVREVEAPRPSAKLSTSAALPTISANRGIEPKKLTGLMRRELDWIVMKAIEKDRARRYETASGFAADVQRYLAGEPVQAHPPTARYRLRKFVRRNKGRVFATGLVLMAMLAGMVGTTWQMLRAEREAERAKAEEAKTKAARDVAERNLVHSIRRPIGYNARGFDQAELVALDELARQEDDQIKLLFLTEALRDGEMAFRVARRAERVVQAAVGTSLKRRATALELLSAKQRDKTADPRVRLCACWLAIELGSEDLPALPEAFDTLQTRKPIGWADYLGQLAPRIHPSQRNALFNAMLAFAIRIADPEAVQASVAGLTELAPTVDRSTAQRGFEALILGLSKSADPYLVPILLALAASVDTAVVGRGFETLIEVFGKSPGLIAAQPGPLGLSQSLFALETRTDPSVVPRAFRTLVDSIAKSPDVTTIQLLGRILETHSHRLDASVIRSGFETLLGIVSKTPDAGILQAAAQAIVTCAPHLDAATNQRGFDALLAVSEKPIAGENWAWPAAMLAGKVTAVSAQQGFRALILLGNKTPNAFGDYDISPSLILMSAKLDPKSASREVDGLIAGIGAADYETLRTTVQAIEVLAPKISSSTAGCGVDAVLALRSKTANPNLVPLCDRGLAILIVRLDATTRQKKLDSFVAGLIPTKETAGLVGAAQSFVVIAANLDAAGARRSADALVRLLGQSNDNAVLLASCEALAALAPRLEANASRPPFDALVSLLGKSADVGVLQAAGIALQAMVPHADSVLAKCAFEPLLALVSKSNDYVVVGAAGYTLQKLSTKLDSASSRRVFDAVVAKIGSTVEIQLLRITLDLLTAVAPGVDPGDAQRGFDTLVSILVGRTGDSAAIQSAGNGLVALTPRLESAAVLRNFDVLVGLLNKPIDFVTWQIICRTLETVCARIDVKVAPRCCQALVGALAKAPDNQNPGWFVEPMLALAPRLDRSAAERTVLALITLLAETPNETQRPVIVGGMPSPGVGGFPSGPEGGRLMPGPGAGPGPGYDSKLAVAIRIIVELDGKLEAATRDKFIDVLIALVEKLEDDQLWYSAGTALAKRIPELDRSRRSTKSFEALRQLLATSRNSTTKKIPESTIAALLGSIESATDLFDLLRDPGTLGVGKHVLLLRLEELAYPNPSEAGVLIGFGAGPFSAFAVPSALVCSRDSRRENRRFRTVSDAAHWINEHLSNVDLDRPYSKVPSTK